MAKWEENISDLFFFFNYRIREAKYEYLEVITEEPYRSEPHENLQLLNYKNTP